MRGYGYLCSNLTGQISAERLSSHKTNDLHKEPMATADNSSTPVPATSHTSIRSTSVNSQFVMRRIQKTENLSTQISGKSAETERTSNSRDQDDYSLTFRPTLQQNKKHLEQLRLMASTVGEDLDVSTIKVRELKNQIAMQQERSYLKIANALGSYKNHQKCFRPSMFMRKSTVSDRHYQRNRSMYLLQQ